MLLYPPRPDALHEECFAALRVVMREARARGLVGQSWWGPWLPYLLSPCALGAIWMAGQSPLPWAFGWMVLGGWLLTCMGLVGHDCTHGACGRGARANYFTGTFIFLHLMMGFEAYRALHLAHHRLNARDEDPSADSPLLTKQTNFLTHVLFILIPVGFPFFQIIPGWLAGLDIRPTNFPPVRRWLVGIQFGMMLAVQRGIYLLLGGWDGYVWFLGAWGVACVLVMQLLAFNHVEIEAYTDCTLCNTRNVASVPVIRWMTLFTGFHVEHHIVPAVPWYRLPELNQVLLEARPGGATYSVNGFLRAHGQVLWIHLRRLLGRLPPETAAPRP